MRREEQLRARLAELEARLQQTGGGHPDSTAAAAADADEAELGAEAEGRLDLRLGSRSSRRPKDQPLTLESVQGQVGGMRLQGDSVW
jgi:hypothetical protein